MRSFNHLYIILLMFISISVYPQCSDLCAYYTRLDFNDHNTGKYADVIVEISGMGKFVFSCEYNYQPYRQPEGGKRMLVERLIVGGADQLEPFMEFCTSDHCKIGMYRT